MFLVFREYILLIYVLLCTRNYGGYWSHKDKHEVGQPCKMDIHRNTKASAPKEKGLGRERGPGDQT